MSGFPEIYARDVDKSPVRCYARFTHNTLAHSIQILYSLPTEYLQIHNTFYTDSKQITNRNKLLFYI